MSKYLTAAKRFVARVVAREEEGASLAEYGLLLALIAVICIAAISFLGTQISAILQGVGTSI